MRKHFAVWNRITGQLIFYDVDSIIDKKIEKLSSRAQTSTHLSQNSELIIWIIKSHHYWVSKFYQV